MGWLVAMFSVLLIVAMGATIYHERQIDRFCEKDAFNCRVE